MIVYERDSNGLSHHGDDIDLLVDGMKYEAAGYESTRAN